MHSSFVFVIGADRYRASKSLLSSCCSPCSISNHWESRTYHIHAIPITTTKNESCIGCEIQNVHESRIWNAICDRFVSHLKCDSWPFFVVVYLHLLLACICYVCAWRSNSRIGRVEKWTSINCVSFFIIIFPSSSSSFFLCWFLLLIFPLVATQCQIYSLFPPISCAATILILASFVHLTACDLPFCFRSEFFIPLQFFLLPFNASCAFCASPQLLPQLWSVLFSLWHKLFAQICPLI